MRKAIFGMTVMLMCVFAANAQNASGNKSDELSVAGTIREFTVEGVTWHAITLKKEKFAAYKKMLHDVFGMNPVLEQPGFSVFLFSNGSMLELYEPGKVPAYGYNRSLAFGFRVSDIEAASAAFAKAGYKMVGEIVRLKEYNYAYVHFKGPDGRIYGLNEQKLITPE